MPARRFTDEQEAAIAKEYTEGVASLVLAEKYGITPPSIFNLLKRQGVKSRGVKNNYGHNKILTAEQEKKLVDRYIGGETTMNLSKEYGIAPGTFTSVLKRNGIDRKKPRVKLSDEQLTKILDMVKQGKSINSISHEYGISFTAIKARVIKNNEESYQNLKAYRTLNWQKTHQEEELQKIQAREAKLSKMKERNDYICQLFTQGLDYKEIAEITDLTITIIGNVVRKAGISDRKITEIPKDKQEQICHLFTKGLSYEEIAKSVNLTRTKIGYVIRKYGFGVNAKKTRVSAEIKKRVVELYQAGVPSTKLIDELGITYALLYSTLKKAGIKAKGRYLSKEKRLEITDMYINQKLTSITIAKSTGLDVSTILKTVVREGYKVRDQKMFDNNQAKQIRDLYLEGYTTDHLSELYECNKTTINETLKRIGVEMRAGGGYSDSVQNAITKEGRFKISRPTSFYVFQLKKFPEFIKPGIAIDPEHRADCSDDEYGDLLLELMFDSREEAFFLESAVLNETISHFMCPTELESADWSGRTEVRLMEFEQMEQVVDFYNLELENLGMWNFAAEYVPMTSDQRKTCRELSA